MTMIPNYDDDEPTIPDSPEAIRMLRRAWQSVERDYVTDPLPDLPVSVSGPYSFVRREP